MFAGVAVACTACGVLLGTDEDADAPPVAPSNDAGSEAAVVEGDGAVDIDAAPTCVTKRAVFANATSVDAAVAADDWTTFTHGTATLGIEGDKLLVHSAGVDMTTSDEGTISTRLDSGSPGGIARVHCTFDVRSSTFVGEGRFMQLRMFADQWKDFYELRLQWRDGQLVAAFQAFPSAAPGTELSAYVYGAVPEADSSVPVVATFLAGDAPSFTASVGDASFTINPDPTGRIGAARAVIGAYAPASGTTPPFDVHIGDVSCEICTR